MKPIDKIDEREEIKLFGRQSQLTRMSKSTLIYLSFRLEDADLDEDQ